MVTQRLLRGMTLGSYRTIRLVSRGGMGEVYEAVDQILERRAAIKIMSIDHDQGIEASSFLSLFTLEARALAQIDHQNVVGVFGVGSHEGVPYIVMEFVDGHSLKDAIAREVLSVEQALAIFIPLFEALASLHEAEVVHRDLKPSNILIRRDGVIKLVDFGIAVRKGWEGTMESDAMGTQDYAAPEVIGRGNSSASSDMWSLGAVLFESLVGVKLSKHRPNPMANVEFPQASQARIPAELRRIIIRLCMADPHDRYQKAEDVVVALTRCYRSNFPGPVVLSTVFKKNLVALVERLDKFSNSVEDESDKTAAMTDTPPAAGPPAVEKQFMPTKKSRVFSNSLKLLKGSALLGALVYAGYAKFYSEVKPPRRVVAASEALDVGKAQNQQVVLVSPLPGEIYFAKSEEMRTDLIWECRNGAIGYRAQIAKDSGFKEITHQHKLKECSWSQIAIRQGEYYWRVRMENDAASWSSPRSFAIQKAPSNLQ